jgi:hypothetical protein
MKHTIPSKKRKQLFDKLNKANTAFQKIYPGDKPERQAVHTVYGGANLFKYNSAAVLGERALETFNTYAPDFLSFGKIFGLEGVNQVDTSVSPMDLLLHYEALPASERKRHPARLSYEVYKKVIKKLETEAIEDFRILKMVMATEAMKRKMQPLKKLQRKLQKA